MFKNFRFTLGRKIFGSFLLLIIFFIINTVIIFNTGSNVNDLITYSSQSVRPSSEKINQLMSLVSRSKMLITNWVNLPSNVENKEELISLHNIEYPKLKEELIGLTINWENDSLKQSMDQIIQDYDRILAIQKDEIMAALSTFDDYEDPMVKFTVDDKLESVVVPSIDQLIDQLGYVNQSYIDVRNQFDKEISNSMGSLQNITFILFFINLIIAFGSAYFLINNITTPINQVRFIIDQLSKGIIFTKDNLKTSDDEVGDMAKSVTHLIEGIKSTSKFSEEIGNGNYNASFTPLSDEDVLGNSLLEMRDNLEKVAMEDKRRSWFNEGVAKFAEILRNNSNDIQVLSDQLLRNLIKYMGVNQGALYLVSKSTKNNEDCLKLMSCFAWDKQKFMDQEIFKGDGLAGQAWQEGDDIFLTDVPDEYIDITSGLGHANPSCVYIVPLKINEEIFGIVELAAFEDIPEYRRNFILKLGESIASTISNVNITAKTKELLDESQMMTEQMKAQEEEMRQNMEELQATQEEMERGQQESRNVVLALNQSVISIELDSDGNIENANERLLKAIQFKPAEVFGETFRIFLKSEDSSVDKFRQLWKAMQEGNEEEGIFLIASKDGNNRSIKGSFIPITDGMGNLKRVYFYGIDVSELAEHSVEG